MPFDVQERCLQPRVAAALQSRTAAEPDFNPRETGSNPTAEVRPGQAARR